MECSGSLVEDFCGCWVVLFLGQVSYGSQLSLGSHGGDRHNYRCHGYFIGGSGNSGSYCGLAGEDSGVV